MSGKIAIRVLRLLSQTHFPGLTRGEIRQALELPPDVEITARIRDLRDKEFYGRFNVRCEHLSGKEYTYWLDPRERARAREFLTERSAQ